MTTKTRNQHIMTMTRDRFVTAAAVALIGSTFVGCAGSKPAQKTAAPQAMAAPMSTPDADYRATKPAAAAGASSFDAPVPTDHLLSNGARLLVVENHAVPLVSIDVLIETGVDGEPLGKGGLAKFTVGMLDEGTKKRTAPQLADQIEDLALNYFSNAGQETTQIRINSLTETLPASLDLLADMIINPAFRKEDVERVRGLLITDLDQKMAVPQLLARDEQARIMYGEKHPWGQPFGGTPQTLKAITVADLTRFHDLYFRPTNAIISVSGDVTDAEITKLLEQKLAAWKKRPRVTVKLPPVKPSTKRAVVLVDKPGASQSQVWTFGPAVPANNPDATALRVASYIVGGPFARLDLNIRENKGYSYGVRANVSLLRDHGFWLAQGGVKANVTAEALTEFEKELTTFNNGELKAGEPKARRRRWCARCRRRSSATTRWRRRWRCWPSTASRSTTTARCRPRSPR